MKDAHNHNKLKIILKNRREKKVSQNLRCAGMSMFQSVASGSVDSVCSQKIVTVSRFF
jgi:hypothetical protein